MTIKTLTPHFVGHFPQQLEPGALYLAMEFATAAHLCACGCGRKVITPFSPTDWQMTFDGEAVSLKPSIGNWSFPCRSHYWIRAGHIVWTTNMSDEAIKLGRARDVQNKARYESNRTSSQVAHRPSSPTAPQDIYTQSPNGKQQGGLWRRFRAWLGGQ